MYKCILAILILVCFKVVGNGVKALNECEDIISINNEINGKLGKNNEQNEVYKFKFLKPKGNESTNFLNDIEKIRSNLKLFPFNIVDS